MCAKVSTIIIIKRKEIRGQRHSREWGRNFQEGCNFITTHHPNRLSLCDDDERLVLQGRAFIKVKSQIKFISRGGSRGGGVVSECMGDLLRGLKDSQLTYTKNLSPHSQCLSNCVYT